MTTTKRLIKINYLSDSSDCEDCGTSWATGATVEIDGVPFGNFIPVANCTGGYHYTEEDILKAIITELGYTLWETIDGR